MLSRDQIIDTFSIFCCSSNRGFEALYTEKTDDIILCVSIGGTVFSANSHSYFVAFQKIRDKLLQQGYGLKCIGARIDVVQSAMASATNKVYITALGNQALKKDLKCLFDYADISEFPNTKEQNEYLEKWIESLG